MTPSFHNIFTSTKIIKPLSKKQKILIDYREKNSLVASEIVALGFEIEFKELKVGDYLVNNIAIERKTVSDFRTSMINRHLLNQIEELQQYENKLLIIEGIDEQELYPEKNSVIQPNKKFSSFNQISDEQSEERNRVGRRDNEENFQKNHGINPNSIRGFLLSILLKHKIPVLFTQNYKDTAKFIERIAMKKETEMGIRAVKKSRNKKEQMQFILEGFPGVGPKTAKKLLEKFSTLQNIFSAPQDELKKIIGKKAEIFLIIEERY